MKALARREKTRGVGPSRDKIHSSAEKKKKKKWQDYELFLSWPIIRLWEGGKWKVTQCCLSPSARTFHYVLNNSEGVFCQYTPGSSNVCRVQVTSIILKLILPPSPPQIPALLWPSAFSKTHTLTPLELLHVCSAWLCSSLGALHVFCAIFCDGVPIINFLKVTSPPI